MVTPFDLHVLGTPPAFILSQDQTLEIKYDFDFVEIARFRFAELGYDFIKSNLTPDQNKLGFFNPFYCLSFGSYLSDTSLNKFSKVNSVGIYFC